MIGRLQRATEFVREHRIPKGERPVYHLTPPTGWMNDPNGFSVYEGRIHLFYQFHPYSDAWGPMHWGHATTEDFLTWYDLPVALAPDTPYDSAGCFSGSAVEHDGRHVLLYTGAARCRTEDGGRYLAQQQCLAQGNGIDYVKSADNPVIPTDLLPAGYSPKDFRDPKVFKDGDRFRTICAAMQPDGNASILLYESEDLTNWRFAASIAENDGSLGDMWECPDFFHLDGKDVLIASPMHVRDAGPDFHDGFETVALIGTLNPETLHLDEETRLPVDYGVDFYAPQTTQLPDGRRVLIAWMQAWENFIKPPEQKWHGMMTFPRELFIRDSQLMQRPVAELEQALCNPVEHTDVTVSGEIQLEGVSGRVLDLQLELSEMEGNRFAIELAKKGDRCVSIVWQPEDKLLTFDRQNANDYGESRRDAASVQSFPVRNAENGLRMRLLLDTCSVEIFLNDGEQTFSSTFYTPMNAEEIAFSCDGSAKINVKKSDICIGEMAV